MSELTREEKLKLVEKLPPHLQEFFYSEDAGDALLYLGQKYKLPDEKVHLLSKLTGDVVLGIKQVASLAQEIYSNILPDTKLAMDLAQELYTSVLAPALTPIPAAPTMPPVTTPTPTAPPFPADRYREPMMGSPEVVDLRKAPAPIAPKPIPPKPVIPVPVPRPVAPPAVSPSTSPRPRVESRDNVEPPPLIEAEPHKVPVPAPLSGMPQVIIRPPGLPPTDRAHDILDLRKDRGEF